MSLFDTNNRTASVTFYRNDMGLITVEVPATNYDSAKRTVLEQYGSVDIKSCLLYTSPSPRDGLLSRMPSSA